ncbi:hypothetical protein AKJ48_01140 [candidate division MSBL1 archaeon SCGC-AAA261O19]|uniref:Metallo-beta-lactamase domain-containing protein n=1 Tax=candidate division MSBL1 archaeon SCGC-AAA261O19 TaxID=1698277 RepID=A0A133VEL2_9EURY|nr:hypothetical protein AKJ48_01140 [candidate division MSBL1 archaeon SCGC-AAA261O19]
MSTDLLYEENDVGIYAIDTEILGCPRGEACYLLKGSEEIALIDPSFPSSLNTLMNGLEDASLKIDDIDRIIVTHTHPDHAGVTSTLLQRNSDMRVSAGELAGRYLPKTATVGLPGAIMVFGEIAAREFGKIEDCPKDKIDVVEDGEKIDLGGIKLKAIYTPGHSPDHVSWYDEESGVLFTGEATCLRFPDLPVLIPVASPPKYDVSTALNSVKKLMKLDKPNNIFHPHFGEIPMDIEDYFQESLQRIGAWKIMIEDLFEERLNFKQIIQRVKNNVLKEAGKNPEDLPKTFRNFYLPTMLRIILMAYANVVLNEEMAW